ncbi:MAG: S1 RNA-binding domain-containing protein [Oscillospiraceae bacterium]
MQINVGDVLKGKVTAIKNFGAFVALGDGMTGLVHISEIAHAYVKEVSEVLSVGDEVEVKVLSAADGKLSLSIKQAKPDERVQKRAPEKAPQNSFEDMLSDFKKTSDEKILAMKTNRNPRKNGGYSRRKD